MFGYFRGMKSEDDLESLRETSLWQSQPGVHEDVAEAETAADENHTVSAADLRARYGLSER